VIAQRLVSWNDVWLAIFFLIGTLVFGASAMWIITNLIAVVYDSLVHFIPDAKLRATLAVVSILGVECKSSALALKSLLIDRPANTLADKAASLIQRYLLVPRRKV